MAGVTTVISMTTFFEIVRVPVPTNEEDALNAAELIIGLKRAVCDKRQAQMTPVLAEQRNGRTPSLLLYLI